MKKITLLALSLLFALSAVKAQTAWVTFKGDNRVSVKFPAEPKEIIKGTFFAMDKDSVGCIFTVVDFMTVANVDSAMLATVKTSPDFTSQLKTGILSALPGATLDDFKVGDYKGYTSYTTTGVDNKHAQYDMFMFLIGSKLYSLSTVRKSGKPVATRDAFFASPIISK